VRQVGEQQGLAGGLQLFEDLDSAGGGMPHDPGRECSGGIVLAFERAAGQFPAVGPPVRVAQGGQTTAVEVFDYWWRGVIPDVRYSR
jgi:hypothetical protein